MLPMKSTGTSLVTALIRPIPEESIAIHEPAISDRAITIPMRGYSERFPLRRTYTNGYLVNAKMLSVLSSGFQDAHMAI